MSAYSLRKLTGRLTDRELEDERSIPTAFVQLDRELALHALPVARAPRLVEDVTERQSAAA